jgi:hypothetical protein
MNFTRIFLGLGLVVLLTLPSAAATYSVANDDVDQKTRDLLVHALRTELNNLTDSKNEEGKRDKRANFSQLFKKKEDGTYVGSAQVNTAGLDSMTTERYRLILAPKRDGFEVTSAEVVDTYVGMHRRNGTTCYNFDKMEFYSEGLTVTASNGGVCEGYYLGGVTHYMVMAPDLAYDYQIPEHVGLIQSGHDFYALRDLLSEQHKDVFEFDAKRFLVDCDAETCEELLNSTFTGIDRVASDERTTEDVGVSSVYEPLRERFEKDSKEIDEERKKNSFYGFVPPDEEGNLYFQASVIKDDDQSLGITYDNWGGYEVRFWVRHALMDREAPRGTVFGYYTEETLKTTDFYELEGRDDEGRRWGDVYKVHADAVAGVDDPEMVSARVEYGLNIKHDTNVLPFVIATDSNRVDEDYRRATLFVNSLRINGEELTWVQQHSFGGFAVLPETAKAGSKLEVEMVFDTQAIRKYTPSYSALARFGWLPFVTFGDFVEDFEMTIRTPSQYKVLGVGHQIEERKEGSVTVTHWKADSPVVFPSVIFGKYFSDKPGFAAKKLDGTEIPVEVHVDQVSLSSVGIRPKQLRAIAEQAANSINLYSKISGVDYPYGSLNLVNDPAPALYGQAPSSLIYLGSLVFRGEGTIAGGGGGGGTSTAKFLKSVVAHEVGHQWWGSRVSNSNQRNYWFVETLAEYFSALYLEAVYGRQEYDEQVEEWRRNVLNNNLKTSVQTADSLWPGESGGGARTALIYNKGPYAFHVLRETFGDEKFFPFLKAFSLELTAKQEIVTRDIQLAAEKHLGGVDLEWFFDQWIRGVVLPEFTLDYSVQPTEDGQYLIKGNVSQEIMIGYGKSAKKVEGRFYRGRTDLTVTGRKKDEIYRIPLTILGESTDFQVKVPVKPVEVEINNGGGMLARDVIDATVARN